MVLAAALFAAGGALASSDLKVEQRARDALGDLYEAQPETRDVIARAAGVLVFPRIFKAGAGVGAEFGEGVLFERGAVTGRYNVASASIGLQLGAQRRAQIIAFMDEAALAKFKASKGWEAGVDGSVVVANLGASGQADTRELNAPILGFILGEKGLMYNATLEGTKITQTDD
jgi:lipid-binding SYLF domain-containing protein